jgi:cysteine-rich repeat protein
VSLKPNSEIVSLAAATAMLLLGSPAVTIAGADSQPASDHPAPAGQLCPAGAYVIGFDEQVNIICSGVCGNGVLDSGEACDDGNTLPKDGCSASCQTEMPEDAAGATAAIADKPAVAEPAPMPSIAGATLAVTDVEPSYVVFGTDAVTITVTGTGFDTTTRIVFDGSSYTPVVNASGTELSLRIETADLTMGRYSLKVSNGAGQEVIVKKALEVF